VDLAAEKTDQAIRGAARQKDNRILDAIEIHTGERWHDMLIIKENLSVARYLSGREVYAWEGTPIISFMPVELITEENGNSVNISARTKYKILV
jgi:hypothetical protein